MTKFDELQQAHQRLLDRMDEVTDKAAFVREVQSYVARIRDEAAEVPDPRDRDQLRANLRYWASYLYDATGTYPNTTMRPPRPDKVIAALPTPPRPELKMPIVWGLAALVALALIVAVLALASSRIGAPAPSTTAGAGQPDHVATQVIEQMMVNATMTKVIGDISTPTPLPTDTPVPTKTPLPTLTATPTNTPTPTPVIVFPETRIPPTVMVAAPPEVVPLGVAYQILTQGPSPFDTAVWVMQLKLVGIGGNRIYIYWINGQRLLGDEYTLQGVLCEPQTLSIGVTSNGHAVKHDITLPSPLTECLKAQPQ